MGLIHEVQREAGEVWAHYRPGLTEVAGLRDVGASLTFLALSSICAVVDPYGKAQKTGVVRLPSPIQCMGMGAQGTALSLIKLTVPIIAGVGYLTYKSCY